MEAAVAGHFRTVEVAVLASSRSELHQREMVAQAGCLIAIRQLLPQPGSTNPPRLIPVPKRSLDLAGCRNSSVLHRSYDPKWQAMA